MHARLSYANVMSTLAVAIALGGTSYAAVTLPRGSVDTKQLRAGAVTDAKVKRGSLTADAFRDGTFAIQAAVRARPIPQSAPEGPTFATASCEPGEIAVGGGYSGSPGSHDVVYGNAPAVNDGRVTGWAVAVEPRGSGFPGSWVAQVVCLQSP
jgi:hypothetical protein